MDGGYDRCRARGFFRGVRAPAWLNLLSGVSVEASISVFPTQKGHSSVGPICKECNTYQFWSIRLHDMGIEARFRSQQHTLR